MVWKLPAALSLLFLTAGAAPPGDCLSTSTGGPTLPASLDLAVRPSGDAGLQRFAALPGLDGASGCPSAPTAGPNTPLRSESGDVLHGLPASESLRPINEPKRAPAFQ